MSKLPGHENCDYSPFPTEKINQAIKAVNEWLEKIIPHLPAARRQLDFLLASEGIESDIVGTVSALLLSLVGDVEAAKETRACLMCEVQNRAQSDHEKWTRDNPGWGDPLLRLL